MRELAKRLRGKGKLCCCTRVAGELSTGLLVALWKSRSASQLSKR
jgi:hypothetical protein